MKNKLLFLTFAALFSITGTGYAMENNDNGNNQDGFNLFLARQLRFGNYDQINPEIAAQLELGEENFQIVEDDDPFDDGQLTPGQKILRDQLDDNEIAEMVNVIDQEFEIEYNKRKRRAVELGCGKLEHRLAKSKHRAVSLVQRNNLPNNNNIPVRQVINFDEVE